MKPKRYRQVQDTNVTYNKVIHWSYLSPIHETREVGLIGLILLKPYSWNTWSRINRIQAFPARHILSAVVKHRQKSQKRDQYPVLYTHKLDHIFYITIYDLLGLSDMI